MKKYKAYTVVELIITAVVITVIASIAISPVLKDLPEHKVKNDIITIERSLKIGKSEATKTSGTVIVDFSQATTNNGENGGLIQIKDSEGTVLDSFFLTKNALFNPESSTIANNEVRFDFKGQPVDSAGSTDNFTTFSNTIVISYYKDGNPIASKSLKISPVTGSVEID
ncbi:MAG TPA: hypothetical protein P5556_04735 [Candidatus Gastranaerophilales bacterium]|nr:hypothetical protein [Candidatus Gastranaerophilales bacterium]